MKKTPIKFMAALCALSAVPATFAATPASRPNILVIMCDDLGYSDVGFNGAQDIRTPNLDKLANAGAVCTSAYVAHPFCGPSRMGLLSGRYPHTYGGPYNLPNTSMALEEYDQLGIPKSEILISTVLKDAGYYTGAIGKWHLGIAADYHPNVRGFDDYYGFLGGGHNYFPEQYAEAHANQINKGTKYLNEYLVPLDYNGKQLFGDKYLTDQFSDHAVQFIQTAALKKTEPFFLYLAYNAPHSPMQAKVEDMAKFKDIANQKRQTYAAMVYAVDRGVEQIVNTLKQTGQYDNTLIIFLSDNGGKPDQGACNAPLRGHKGDTFEGGFRVPMFFHWPKEIPAQKFDFPVTSLDFYPTFAALGGATIPTGKQLDGKDILANLAKGTNPRKGEMIYSLRHRGGFTDVSARSDDWKVVRFGNQPWRLFNISEDISETTDLAKQYPERVAQMVKAAEKWNRGNTIPQWFDSPLARDKWFDSDMPHYDQTFEPVTGAAALPPVDGLEITCPEPTAKTAVVIPAAPAGVVLKTGDSTTEQFIAQERIKWDQNGWRWDQSKVDALVAKFDTNGDGIISGLEKKEYWSGGAKSTSNKKAPTQSIAPTKATVQLKTGDSTKAQFLAREKSKWDQQGWRWDQSKVEGNFNKMDTNGDGILSGIEKKNFYSK